MTTLTANTQRLPEHCAHKLPTSCQLTATPLCCACADKRPHSPSYSVYVDGVGSVLRGTRWQRYCWMCKEFWSARVAATNPPISPSQTRVPEVPDQSEFLECWYDHHRGYRMIKHEDGSEQRIEVTGEPLNEVPPGHLPRSLEELREAQTNREQLQSSDSESQSYSETEDDPERLSSALSAALNSIRAATRSGSEDNHEESGYGFPSRISAMDRNIRRRHGDQAIYITALRRELEQLRSSTERVMASLHGLGERADESLESMARSDFGRASLGNARHGSFGDRRRASRERRMRSRLTPAANQYERRRGPDSAVSMASIQERLDAANAALNGARSARERAADQLEASESNVQAARERVRQLEREYRTAENYTRAFGSREEIERLGVNYESPITGMFNRAWTRYREREEERRRDRILREIIAAEEQVMEGRSGELSSVAEANQALEETRFNSNDEDALNEYYAGLRGQGWSQMPLGRDISAAQAFSPLIQPGGYPPNVQSRNEAGPSIAPADQLFVQQNAVGTAPQSTAQNEAWVDSPARRSLVMWLRNRRGPFNQPEAMNYESSEDEDSGKGLDIETDGRPPPKETEELTVNLECKICYTQLADTVVLPCGHLVMCQWCAAMHVPSHRLDRTRPANMVNCPMCRKKVKQKAQVFRG